MNIAAGDRLTGWDIPSVCLLGGYKVSHFIIDVFGVFPAIGSYPLRDFIAVAFEIAH